MLYEKILITVDGPSGAGKGTLCAYLAQEYTLLHLDTGLLFRALACRVADMGLDSLNEPELAQIALSVSHEDFSDPRLRTETTADLASQIAKFSSVRQVFADYQRRFVATCPPHFKGVILDGRDIGTVVLPQAPCKFFVTASLERRSQRRHAQLGDEQSTHQVEQAIRRRDQRDTQRDTAPLVAPPDALCLDTTFLSIVDMVAQAKAYVDQVFNNIARTQSQ